MIFGIKTKKDKKIEELELRLSSMCYKHPTIIAAQQDTICLGASVIIEDDMSIEFAKRRLAEIMMKEVERQIWYDVEDVNSKKLLRGYLRVVAKTI